MERSKVNDRVIVPFDGLLIYSAIGFCSHLEILAHICEG